MKITHKQLRQIIKEELIREMQRMPIGKGMFGKGPAMAMSRLMMKRRAAPVEPPNLRLFEVMGEACGTCVNFCPETQTCMAFNDYQVSADRVCDAWQGDS